MLTIACVWVKGHVPFTAQYVRKLQQMVQRSVKRKHRFVCLTDRPELLNGIDTIRIPSPAGIKGWWSKLHVFRDDIGLSGRILYLDLDTLIVGNLDEVIDYPAPFALIPHAGTFNGKGGLAVVKRFNSSVMVFDSGSQAHIYERFTPDVPRKYWGDQDAIGAWCPDAATFPLSWFPRISEVAADFPRLSPDAKVVLCKTPKNELAAKTIPGFAEAWG